MIAKKTKNLREDRMKQVKEQEKPVQVLGKLPPKQAAFAILKENGLRTPDAAKVLGWNTDYAYQIQAKLGKHSLTSTQMVKSASKVVKNILDGKPWGSIDKIKDGSALMAAQMVYDRVQPIKRDADQVQATPSAPISITVLFGGTALPQESRTIEIPSNSILNEMEQK
jgi:hypothetical protein